MHPLADARGSVLCPLADARGSVLCPLADARGSVLEFSPIHSRLRPAGKSMSVWTEWRRPCMLYSIVRTRILGIIPARFASSRFPGKSLSQLAGKPMVQHVYERALMAQYLNAG